MPVRAWVSKATGLPTFYVDGATAVISADGRTITTSSGDAAVVSVPDDYLGERSCAFITPRGERPRPAELKKWIRAQGLADFKVPDQFVFVDHFVETAALKLSRKALRAHLRAQLDEKA